MRRRNIENWSGPEHIIGLCKYEASQYLNRDSGLLVLVSGEDLGLLGWDNSVSGDQFSHYPTNGFNTKGERSDIQEKNICTQETFNNESEKAANSHIIKTTKQIMARKRMDHVPLVSSPPSPLRIPP